jgi:hypothetical protein
MGLPRVTGPSGALGPKSDEKFVRRRSTCLHEMTPTLGSSGVHPWFQSLCVDSQFMPQVPAAMLEEDSSKISESPSDSIDEQE